MSECKQCGECCRWVSVKLASEPSKDELRWLEMRGEVVDGRWRIKSVCPFLEGNICLIYGSRPDVCKDYEAGGEMCRKARKA